MESSGTIGNKEQDYNRADKKYSALEGGNNEACVLNTPLRVVVKAIGLWWQTVPFFLV